MKRVDFEHFGRFLCPYNLSTKNGTLYYTVRRTDFYDDDYKSDLYAYKKKGGQKQLTFSGDITSYYLLDDCILFTSIRKDSDKESVRDGAPLTVIHALEYGGGEAREIARIDQNVVLFNFLEPRKFFFTGVFFHALADIFENNGGNLADALAKQKSEAGCQVIDEIPFWQDGTGFINKTRKRLYFFDDGKIIPITDKYTNVEAMALSPDKTTLIFSASIYRNKNAQYERLFKLKIPSLKTSDISISEKTVYMSLGFLSDDEVVVHSRKRNGYGLYQNPDVYRFSLSSGKVSLLYDQNEYSMENTVCSDIKATRTIEESMLVHGKFHYFISTAGCDSHIIKLHMPSGVATPLTKQPGSIEEAVVYGDGFAAIAMRGSTGCEVYTIDLRGKEKKLTSLNDHCSEYEAAVPERISFTNKDAFKIQGFVLPPREHEAGKKYPAILNIHGGPKAAFGSVYSHEMQLWANMGYAVIFCNPTGSDGQGSDFADIRGKYGDADYDDIITFVDRCISECDFVDPNHLGITGGSYGGFMTNWIIGHTTRFRAAVSQSSISNWITFMTMSDIGHEFAPDQLGATPWSDIEEIWRLSPIKYADQVDTPTLFIHADQDYRCNMSETVQMFSSLRYYGVPSRICLFQGETHDLSRSGKPTHRIRRLKEMTEWFETYLK